METIIPTVAVESVPVICGLSHDKATALVIKAGQLELSRMEGQKLRQEFIALLPEATEEQLAKVLVAAGGETDHEEGYGPNKDFRLTPEQLERVKGVKDERKLYLGANKRELCTHLLTDESQVLRSLKVRQGVKAITTTARFVKATVSTSEKRGLLAALAKAGIAIPCSVRADEWRVEGNRLKSW